MSVAQRRNHDVEWEDQGLFFTLTFNAVALPSVLIVAYLLHRMPWFAHALRPNRPGSKMATIFQAPNALFAGMAEEDVADRLGARPMYYIVLLKFLVFLFLLMAAASIVIVPLCATDDYLDEYRFEKDPNNCRGNSRRNCERLRQCTWVEEEQVANGSAGNGAARGRGECVPAFQRGLADFSIQNIAPNSWRLYIFAITTLLITLPLAIAVRDAVKVIYDHVRGSFTRPLAANLPFGGFATVGARTVLISGLPVHSVVLTSAEKIYEYINAEPEQRKAMLKEEVDHSLLGQFVPWRLRHASKSLISKVKQAKNRITHGKRKKSGKHQADAASPSSLPPTAAEHGENLHSDNDDGEGHAPDAAVRAQHSQSPSPAPSARENSCPFAAERPSEQDMADPAAAPHEYSEPGRPHMERRASSNYSAGGSSNRSHAGTAGDTVTKCEGSAAAVSRVQHDSSFEQQPHRVPITPDASLDPRDERRPEFINDDEGHPADDNRVAELPQQTPNEDALAKDGVAGASPQSAASPQAAASPSAPAAPAPGSLSLKPAARKPLGPPHDLNAPSWDLAKFALRDYIYAVQEAPPNLPDLIEEEEEIIEKLTDAVAEEQKERDPAKKPVKKRLFPQLWKKVDAVDYETQRLHHCREKIRPLLAERDQQPMAGAVMITFDRASTAAAFVRSFNDEHNALAFTRASIAGPRERVVWRAIGVNAQVRRARTLTSIAAFIALVFTWSIPVGFAGSLANLESIPGIGVAVSGILDALPRSFVGTLDAVLPSIVLTVFNILLPKILHFFGRLSGVTTKDREMREVLTMCTVFSVITGIVMQAALQGGFTQAVDLIIRPTGPKVVAFLVAVVSPAGGYWYSLLITAACLGVMLKLLEIVTLLKTTILGKATRGRQEAYDRLFDPREIDTGYLLGRHIFFIAIGLLFHGTVSLLLPFSLLYSVTAYLVERSRFIDGGERDSTPIIDHSYLKSAFHAILGLHTAAAGCHVVVCALKLSYGSAAICVISLGMSIALHIFVEYRLGELVHTTPELVAAIERDADHLMLPREQVEDATPFVPDFEVYELDEDVEERINRLVFRKVDKRWPRPGTKLEEVDRTEPDFCCFAPAAQKRQTVKFLDQRLRRLEKENDKLREFKQIAREKAYVKHYGHLSSDGEDTGPANG